MNGASIRTVAPTMHPAGSPGDLVSVNSARLIRPRRAPQSALRDFEADIETGATVGDGATVIGRISGSFSWFTWLPELVDDTHTNDHLSELIAAALDLGDRLSTEPGSTIEAVLMIDRVRLEAQWTHRLGRRIAEQLIDLLLLTPESTLVLVHLGPHADPTGHLAPGLEPDPVMQTAHGTPRPADFEQWRTSNTWWIRPGNPSQI
jgi:hypothetical protein